MNTRRNKTRDGMEAGGWLHLAASPTFVAMALLSDIADGSAADIWCSPMHGVSSLGGMTAMYLLMATFHASPWLKRGLHWWHRMQRLRSRHRRFRSRFG